MSLLEKLKTLDPTDASLWTADGLPKLDAVSQLVGKAVTREEVNSVAFGLTKSNVATYTPPADKVEKAPAPAQVAEPTVDESALIAQITVLDEEIIALQTSITDTNKLIDEKSLAVAELRKQLAKEDDPNRLQSGIQAFFAAGDADRREQEARERAFYESGLNLSDILSSVSPIDKRKQP